MISLTLVTDAVVVTNDPFEAWSEGIANVSARLDTKYLQFNVQRSTLTRGLLHRLGEETNHNGEIKV